VTPLDKAKSMMSNFESALTQQAKKVSRKVSQEDSWEQAFAAVDQLSEIARAQQSLLVDLIDRVDTLETQAGLEVRSRGGNR
jgi:uncharacterized protein YbaP (TraB family)